MIGEGARVERAILDKLVRIDRGARIGGRRREAEGNGRETADSGITTVGKDAHIPAGIRVARGAVVAADATPEYFESAATAQRARRRRPPPRSCLLSPRRSPPRCPAAVEFRRFADRDSFNTRGEDA